MIGIVYIGNINRCPYLKKYTDSLDGKGIEYDIIFWDRASKSSHSIERSNANKLHIFKLKSKERRKPYKKIIDFYKFSRFTRRIIKEQKYEKLIVLTTMTGIILFPELLGRYKKRYIFDYRDASYEYIKPFYMLVSKIINNSFFTCISSKGFLQVLPKNKDYIIAHNISNYKVAKEKKEINKDKYVIGYIGGLRPSDYMKEIVNIFGGDSRFELKVHGGGENYKEMVNYSKEHNNVFFTGPYNENEKKILLKDIDIICYNYSESFNNNIALANKYYDALIERIPLLGNIKTYSGKLIKENGLGISLEFNDVLYKEKLYEYLDNIDYNAFNKRCNSILKDIMIEDKFYIEKIEEFLISGN